MTVTDNSSNEKDSKFFNQSVGKYASGDRRNNAKHTTVVTALINTVYVYCYATSQACCL